MSTKVKLVSLISAFVLVLAIMMVAVMAVPTVTLNIGGNISFTATDLQVTISQGALANGTVEDSANKMQEVKIDAYDDGAEELATWTNLNLTFNESGEDMTITFTITNNSTVDDIQATVTVDQGTTDNATVSVATPSSSSVRIPANDGSQQFVVTFHIDNRNDSASIENFKINIDLEKYVEPITYDYFDFDVNSDGTTVTLTSFDEDLADNTDIVIPESVSQNESGQWTDGNTYKVTDILSATSSGNGVFYSSGITSVELPSTLETIGNYSFYYCRGLSGDLVIPEGVTSIGECAFYGCSGLTGKLVIPEGVTSIGNNAFCNCRGITSITLPSSLTSIEYQTFSGCSGLTSITLPSSLTSIGSNAFSSCSGLTSITLPSRLTEIEGLAFYNCRALTEVNYNAVSVADLSNTSNVFHGAGQDGIGIKVNFGEGVKTIPSYLFYANDETYAPNIEVVNFSSTITSIGDWAFNGCSGLTGALDLSNCTSLTTIGSNAFAGCSGLTGALDLSNCTRLTSIGDSAFYGCSGLTSVTINQYVFENAISPSVSSCGALFGNISSGETVLVPANLIDDLGLTNFYLDLAFTRSETANEDGYYVYTKN